MTQGWVAPYGPGWTRTPAPTLPLSRRSLQARRWLRTDIGVSDGVSSSDVGPQPQGGWTGGIGRCGLVRQDSWETFRRSRMLYVIKVHCVLPLSLLFLSKGHWCVTGARARDGGGACGPSALCQTPAAGAAENLYQILRFHSAWLPVVV